MRIPLSSPDVTEPEIEAVAATLRSPQLSLGTKLVEFETAFTKLTGADHAIAVSSGTAGLHLALRALDIGEGDEVIVPSFTFIAVANAVRYERAAPVFVDIDPRTLNMSPGAVEAAVTPRTRAIIAVHTFGVPAHMHALLQIANRYGLAIIEDACEAIGATVNGRTVGSFGDISVFAFYPNKQITTGEGGMVITQRADLAERMRSLRNQGRAASGAWLQHDELGYNYRLSEIACTLGVGQMQRLDSILARREQIARRYESLLANELNLERPVLDLPGVRISWFVYVVRLPNCSTSVDRDGTIAELELAGIGCGRYFAPIHLQPAYAEWRGAANLPVTESVASRTIALPFFNRINDEEIAEVCAVLKSALERIG